MPSKKNPRREKQLPGDQQLATAMSELMAKDMPERLPRGKQAKEEARRAFCQK